MGRIFANDGKTLIIAMDGSGTLGPIFGMTNIESTLVKIVEGKADAVLATYGIAKKFVDIIKPLGLLLRCDGGVSTVDDNTKWKLLYDAEDALRIGADAVVCNAFPRSTGENLTLGYLADLVANAAPWNMPVLAEALTGGFTDAPEHRTDDAIAFAVRAASEVGANFIKTMYTGTVEGFKKVIDSSYLPVVALGGPAGHPEDFLRHISDAMKAGASGAAVGRQVWQHKNPQAMTEALFGIIHNTMTLEEAIDLIR
jgi:DhnA family fructose-bisphosphate aldolase class Ia